MTPEPTTTTATTTTRPPVTRRPGMPRFSSYGSMFMPLTTLVMLGMACGSIFLALRGNSMYAWVAAAPPFVTMFINFAMFYVNDDSKDRTRYFPWAMLLAYVGALISAIFMQGVAWPVVGIAGFAAAFYVSPFAVMNAVYAVLG